MARTTAEEGEGEAATGSRSSSRASRRRQRRNPEAAGSPTPPTVITRSRASQSESPPPPPPPPSRHGKRKRSGTAEERRGGRATGRDGEENAEKEQEEEVAAPHEENAEKEQQEEEEAAAASASPPGEHASSGASSAVSSPLRWPSLPRVVLGETAFGETIFEPFEDIDPAIFKAYEKLRTRYFAKQDRQLKLASLDNNVRLSCFINTKLNHVRESATKTILQIAKVVLGLSSYIDGKLLGQSSGFLIE